MLENLAYGNPLLLSFCITEEDNYCASKAVRRVVRRYISSLFESLNRDNFQFWIKSILSTYIEMFHYAYNDTEIPISNVIKYEDTWLAAENITYINMIN